MGGLQRARDSFLAGSQRATLRQGRGEENGSGGIWIGSDRQPKTKQGIEGKIVRFRSGRVRDRVGVRDKDRRSEPDRRSEAITFGVC